MASTDELFRELDRLLDRLHNKVTTVQETAEELRKAVGADRDRPADPQP